MEIRALIVDDEKSNRENLQTIIGKYCPQVLLIGEAPDIQTARQLIEALQPDLVFLDVRMPGGDGF